MTDFFRRTGLLPGTAFVVASNAPAATLRQARILKARYGALIQICDGTNDEVEILAAINSLPTLSWTWWASSGNLVTRSGRSGTVVLLEGDYNLDAVLTYTGALYNFCLVGYGAHLHVNHIGHGLVFNLTTQSRGITCEGFDIEGNRYVAGPGVGDNIQINATAQSIEAVSFVNLRVQRAGRDGIHFNRGAATNNSWWRIIGSHFGDYMVVDDTVPSWIRDGNFRHDFYGEDLHHLNVVGNHFDGTGAACLYFATSVYQVQITGNEFSYGGWNPGFSWPTAGCITFNVTAGVAVEIVGNNFENRDSSLVLIGAGVEGLIFANNTMIGGPQMIMINPLPITGGYRGAIKGNIWHTTGTGWQSSVYLRARYWEVGGNAFYGTPPTYNVEENTDADYNVIKDNVFNGGIQRYGIRTIVEGNRGQEITDVYDLIRVKNTSGGPLVVGDVVIQKAVAAGNEITTTATQGDDMVLGMVAETIADTAYGLILVEGKTVSLKVNGTTAIAIGDLLGTFTTAKIAMKAAVGDMAFAIALEAYAVADSNGVIDALLIKPRKL